MVNIFTLCGGPGRADAEASKNKEVIAAYAARREKQVACQLRLLFWNLSSFSLLN